MTHDDDKPRRDPCRDAAMRITCEECAEFLMDYLDDRVSSEQRFVFESHIALCRDCEVYVANYQHTLDLTRELALPEAEVEPMPDALAHAILAARVHEHRAPRSAPPGAGRAD
jgi:anti-sigma factor RsiW